MNQILLEENDAEIIEYEQTGFSLNLTELKSMVYRQRKIVSMIMLFALLAGLCISLLTTPVYEAKVSIQIDQDSNDVIEDRQAERRLRGNDIQRYLNSQVEIVKSRKMAARVAKQLGLMADDNFLLAMRIDSSVLGSEREPAQDERRKQVLKSMIENVDIILPVSTKVATISFDSPNAKIAQDVANAYAENLITGNIEQRFEATSYARDFLEKEIGNSKQRLEESERIAIKYAQNKQIIDASDGVSQSREGGAPRSITTANLVQMNADFAVARTTRIKAEEKWLQATKSNLASIPDVLQNQAIQSLQSERAREEGEYREISERYKPDHPVALQAKSQIASLKKEIRQLESNIFRSIRGEYEVARNQERAIARNLQQLKNTTLGEQNKRVELNLLARDVETNRAQYQSLLERYKQVSASADVVTNNIVIIDRAEGAEKIAPKPLTNILLAGFAGLAMSLLVVFLRETLDDAIRTPEDVSRKLGFPLLGTTPVYEGEESIVATLGELKSELAEAYASIRSSIDFSSTDGAPKTILVTSSQPSEGKSTTSIALADSFARSGKRVLLVDSDLRNPSLHKYLNLKNNKGFTAILTGNSQLKDEVLKTDDMNFDFLPCGRIPSNPAEILMANVVTAFSSKIEGLYDHIIFDGPPVMGLADAPQISRATEGTVVVVEANRIRGGQTKSALRRLVSAEANILGVVLSKFNGKDSGYGDYYGDYYSYRSGSGDS